MSRERSFSPSLFRPGGIALVFGLAYVALAFVMLSITGNLLASFSREAGLGKLVLENYRDLAAEPSVLAVTARTLVFGLGSVAVTMLFAFPIAWVLARSDFRWKRLTIALLVAKLAIPGFITAMSYIWLFNPTSGIVNRLLGVTELGAQPIFNIYSLAWICFIQGIVLVPASVFLMLPAFYNMDGTLEEAAWVSGVPPARTIRRIVLPLLAPAILGSTLFFFVVAVEAFDIVGLIGIPGGISVLSIWIYDALHPSVGVPDYGFAGAIGMLLFVLSGVAIAAYVRLLRRAERYAVMGGKGRATPPQPLGRWTWPVMALIAFWTFAAFIIPIVTLLWVSLLPFLQPPSMQALELLSLQSFRHALRYLQTPVVNTLVVGIGAILLTLTWSASICWVVTRSRSRAALWVDTVIFLSPAIPSMVAAVAFQYLGIALYQWLPLYGTIWLIAIVMSTRMLAFCTRTMNAASWQIDIQLDEAARVSGVSQFKSFRHIFLPILKPALFYSGVMVGLLSMRELTVPLIINTGQAPLVSTLIFDLQMNGDHDVSAAISTYMILFLVGMVALANRLAGGGEPRQIRHGRRRAKRSKATRKPDVQHVG